MRLTLQPERHWTGDPYKSRSGGVFAWMKTWLPIGSPEKRLPSRNRHIPPARYFERITDITSSPTSNVGNRGDSDQLAIWPVEHHGKRNPAVRRFPIDATQKSLLFMFLRFR
jgi:hypothetical protein